MEKLIVTIDSIENARMVANMLWQLSFITNVQMEDEPEKDIFFNKNKSLYLGNPMNEDDIRQMISECESEPYFTSDEARKLSMKIMKAWEKQKV